MQTIQYVYEIFRTNEANNGTDILNVGLPMFLDDIMKGKNNHCPVNLDFEGLKKQWDALTVDQRQETNEGIRKFIQNHYDELVNAYPDRDMMLEIGKE